MYDRLGIRLSPKKKTLVANRVMRRLRETCCATFGEYLDYLEGLGVDDVEWDAFTEEITTHETYMFRDPVHWEWFEKDFLPLKKAEASRRRGVPSLRIWSAACSSGEEPYTIAACVAGSLVDVRRWRIQIIASDVAVGALKHAERGEFSEKSMRMTPERYRRFFRRAKGENLWRPNPILRELITFRHHNLLHVPRFEGVDLAVVKNVLIYFDGDSKQRAIAAVRRAIKPGGFLLAGSAEGIAEWAPDCERLRSWLVRLSGAPRKDGPGDGAAVGPSPTLERDTEDILEAAER